MHRSVSIVALTLTLAALAQAQDLVHLDSHSNRLKVQNGHFISWENVSTDPSANQVKIYSKQGSLLTTIPILRLVPEALRVTIFDVATNPSGMVTIAAVYGREQGKLPASTLLYFDAKGHLVSAITLHPTRQISRLAVDENSNVWTLTITAARKDPAGVPMLVEYDATGHQVRELLKRSEFPGDAAENRDDLGLSGFGYENGTLWFWLPASQDFVTVDVNQGSVAKIHTGLPNKSPAETPMGIFRDSKGLVVRIIERPGPNVPGTWAFFRWSPSTQAWTKIQPVGCENQIHAFIGLENGRGIFAHYPTDGGVNICASEF